eukprot:scaffold55442_cov19-Tisochrysis_lutea.AAC.4
MAAAPMGYGPPMSSMPMMVSAPMHPGMGAFLSVPLVTLHVSTCNEFVQVRRTRILKPGDCKGSRITAVVLSCPKVKPPLS